MAEHKIVLAMWLTKAEARKIRRQYLLRHLDNGKLAYIAKVDFGERSNVRRAWTVFGDK